MRVIVLCHLYVPQVLCSPMTVIYIVKRFDIGFPCSLLYALLIAIACDKCILRCAGVAGIEDMRMHKVNGKASGNRVAK